MYELYFCLAICQRCSLKLESISNSVFLFLGDCPNSHPYVYRRGDYCCKYNKENVFARDGEFCDGSELTFESKCCQNNAMLGCPHGDGNCRDNQGTRKCFLTLLRNEMLLINMIYLHYLFYTFHLTLW